MSLSPFWVDARERESLIGERYYWSRIVSSGNGEIVYMSEMYAYTEQAMMKTARKMAAALGCALRTIDGEWETP